MQDYVPADLLVGLVSPKQSEAAVSALSVADCWKTRRHLRMNNGTALDAQDTKKILRDVRVHRTHRANLLVAVPVFWFLEKLSFAFDCYQCLLQMYNLKGKGGKEGHLARGGGLT